MNHSKRVPSAPRSTRGQPSVRVQRSRLVPRGPVRGRLAGCTPEGYVLVRWGSRDVPPCRAWLASHVNHRALLDAIKRSAEALIDFIDGDPKQPVILALLCDRLGKHAGLSAPEEPHLTLRAGENLSLECGQSSITLTREGRVSIRGTLVHSESSGPVKIKGAYVEVN